MIMPPMTAIERRIDTPTRDFYDAGDVEIFILDDHKDVPCVIAAFEVLGIAAEFSIT